MRTGKGPVSSNSCTSSIASVYGSSPVEHPADQIVSGRPVLRLRREQVGEHVPAERLDLRQVPEEVRLLDRDRVEQLLTLDGAQRRLDVGQVGAASSVTGLVHPLVHDRADRATAADVEDQPGHAHRASR